MKEGGREGGGGAWGLCTGRASGVLESSSFSLSDRLGRVRKAGELRRLRGSWLWTVLLKCHTKMQPI